VRRFVFGEWAPGDVALTAEQVSGICDAADRRREAAASAPLDRTLALLARVRERWLDPGYGPRRAAEAELPDVTGFTPEMVRLGMEAVCWTLDPENLERKIATELSPDAPRGGRFLAWQPLGVVLHVLAGNVFVGAAGSLVEGAITGNVNILKVSSSEQVFLPRLVEAIVECDSEGVLAPSLAVVDFASSSAGVIAELKRRVDGIVVWGGEDAVRGYRDGLPARTRLVVFGPKLSVALVTAAGLSRLGASTVATQLAGEIAIWDQNACTAPQACYVEGDERARELARELASALDAAAARLPAGRVEMDTAVEIRKLRTVAEVAEARGEGLLVEPDRGLAWTVIVERRSDLVPSPLARTLRIVPYGEPRDVLAQLEAMRGYVQTVGLATGAGEALDLARDLGRAGALRIVDLGRMAGGDADDPHDGAYDLPQLMHLVVHRLTLPGEPGASGAVAGERGAAGAVAVELLSDRDRQALVDGRLRRLVERARRAPFYRERLAGLAIATTADLERVPPLTRHEMDRNMPPRGDGLSTGPFSGGYVSRSGGSTGEPKFSIYDGPDWEHMIAEAVRCFRTMGLAEGDRLANFMLAGDLYGSFVSFDHINVRIGVTTFAFAGSARPEVFARVWRDFRINAVQGVPTTLVPFLRAVKALVPELAIEKVMYAGSPMSDVDREWLRAALGARRIASVIGANDGGAIAYQCAAQSGALHHVLDDFNFVEIAGDDGRRVPDGEPGRVLITSLLKLAFPLIRYEIGDLGRIVPGQCSCGRTARRLEYMGRADDVLCVGLLNVCHADVVRALSQLPVTHVQVAARSDSRGEALSVRVEWAPDAPAEASPGDRAARVRAALLSGVAKLAERLEQGALAGLGVEVLAPGTLARNPRTGKVRNVVDERG
jgi:phenylacetate-coenzyme A ligase PaaK-like adenylate-forming protein